MNLDSYTCKCGVSPRTAIDWETHQTREAELRSRLKEAEEASMEQARLVGMGSEREARLMARVGELEEALKDARYALHVEGGLDG